MTAITIAVTRPDTGQTTEHRFDQSPVRIGRNDKNDLPLPYTAVSGWHAMITFGEGPATFVDLGSTNGTYRDGKRLKANAAVEIGEGVSLNIDKIVLQIRMTPAAPRLRPTAARRVEPTLEGLVSRVLPDQAAPAGEAEMSVFLDRVASVLESTAANFVTLQGQLDQLESELGVTLLRDRGPLQQANDARQLLSYLLDWRNGGAERTEQFQRSFSDLMVHQVALINAILEGLRAALRPMDPQVIEHSVTGGFPSKANAMWNRYRERFDDLTSKDNLVRAVFSEDFTRSYAEQSEAASPAIGTARKLR